MDAVRGINRRLPINVTDALRVRFERLVDKREPLECWPWKGGTRDGYGAIGHDGHVLGTHRVAFVLAFGNTNELVLHSCDNRICCNPNHLEAGSHSQNMKDMIARGRRQMRGESAPSTTIRDSDAVLVKAARVATGFGTARLSRCLPISRHVIKKIIEHATWTHIPWPSIDEAREYLASHGLLTDLESGAE